MKISRSFYKRPKLIIGCCLIITAVLGYFITRISIDNSIRQFLPQKDASYTRLTDAEDTFGSMIVIGVSIESNEGTILTPENIEIVRKITDRCLDIPQVEGIDSLTHIDYVCESNGSISASKLIPDEYTGTEADISQLKSRLTEWADMYNRVIINDDCTGTQMQITLHSMTAQDKIDEEVKAKAEHRKVVTDAERQQKLLEEIREIVVEETENKPVNFKIFGDPVVAESARNFMVQDLLALIPLVIVVVLLSLYFSFKSLDGTLLPLITVVMATAWTMGLMSLFGITFTLVSSVIPVALIAVGSAYGIHVLTHYYVALESINGEFTREKYEDAIFEGLNDVLFAVFLAGITTVVGFISLISSPIEPLHSFAIFTAVGVAISLVLAVIFIPAVLLCKDFTKINNTSGKIDKLVKAIKEKKENSKLTKKINDKIEKIKKRKENMLGKDTLYGIYYTFCGSGTRLLIFVICLVFASYFGLRGLKIDTALVNYFQPKCDMRQDIDYVDEEFAGTNSVHFIVKGPEKGSLTNPEILKAVDDMQQELQEEYDSIGKIVSFTTFIKRINQVWHVPGQEEVSAQDTSVLLEENSGFDSFDAFGDFGDSFESFDDSVSDSNNFDAFADFADSTEQNAAELAMQDKAEPEQDLSKWVDPNIEYLKNLENKVTTEAALEMLNQAYIEAGGKVATADKIVETLQKKFNYNGMSYYEIPYDISKYPVPSKAELSGVVNGYLTLLSGSLDRFLDDEMNPQVMRITCQLRNHSTEETGKILKAAQKYAAEHFPEGYTIEATGAGEMEYTMTKMIVSSQLSSLLISLLSVFLIIAISFKSAFAGILGAVPLALAILLNYMVMGFVGINLDLVTSIIASVAVGVGIDYTIHFMSTYKEERKKSDNLEEVTKMTFRKSGHGIVTNAIAVGLGFLVLCFSKFIVLRYIGVLVALVMFTSSFLAMTVIPGCLNVFKPKFIRPVEKD